MTQTQTISKIRTDNTYIRKQIQAIIDGLSLDQNTHIFENGCQLKHMFIDDATPVLVKITPDGFEEGTLHLNATTSKLIQLWLAHWSRQKVRRAERNCK